MTADTNLTEFFFLKICACCYMSNVKTAYLDDLDDPMI